MQIHFTRRIAYGIAMLVFCAISGQANAQNQQDYCIKCTNPGEIYICRIVSNGASAQGRQLLCIMNLARENSHDSCAATTQAQSCSGVLVQYEVNGTDKEQASFNESAARQAIPTQVAPPAKISREPRTLVEFTKQTTKATQKSIKSAGKDTSKAFKKTGKKISKFTKKVGKNITKASQKTWKCVTSLFFSCGSN